MNPDTGRFERLASEIEEKIAANKGWVPFEIGELVSIKGQQFRIVDVGQTHVVLRSRAIEADATEDDARREGRERRGGDGHAA